MSIFLDPSMVQGLDTDLARIAALEADVAALKPGGFVSPVGADYQIDLTPYQDGSGRFDITVGFNDLSPSDANVALRAQLSVDGGTSWVATNYYAADIYSTSANTNVVSLGTVTQINARLSHNMGNNTSYGASGHVRIIGAGNFVDFFGHINGVDTGGAHKTWLVSTRHRGITNPDTVRIFFDTGTIDGGSLYITDNLRPS